MCDYHTCADCRYLVHVPQQQADLADMPLNGICLFFLQEILPEEYARVNRHVLATACLHLAIKEEGE
jgi:hypothetical protein